MAEAQTRMGEQRAAERKRWAKLAANGDLVGLNSMAWSMATSPDPALRDGKSAVGFAEQAAAATNRKHPPTLDTLAAAYAEAGDFTKAVAVQQEAVGLVRDEDEKKDFASRVKLYAAKLPFREIDYDELYERAGTLQVHRFSKEAEKMLRDALDVKEGSINEEDPRVAKGFQHLGEFLVEENRLAEAEDAFRRALALKKRVFGDEHPKVSASHNDLALLLHREGKLAEAETMFRDRLVLLTKLGNEHEEVEKCLFNLGATLKDQGKFVEAEPIFRESLVRLEKLSVNDSMAKARTLDSLAVILLSEDKISEAESTHRNALTMRLRTALKVSEDSDTGSLNAAAWFLATAEDEKSRDGSRAVHLAEKAVAATIRKNPQLLDTLAAAYAGVGEFEKAASVQQEALALPQDEAKKKQLTVHLELYKAHKPCRDVDLNWPLQVAAALSRQGKLSEAEAVLRDAIAKQRSWFRDQPPDVALALNNLAVLLQREGKLAEAETTIREALLIQTKPLGGDHPEVAESLETLAGILRDERKLSEAEAIDRERLQILRKRSPTDDAKIIVTLAQLSMILLAEDRFTEAEPLARECLSLREKKMPDNWSTFNMRCVLGGSLLGQKKYVEAEPLLLSGYEGMKQREGKISAIGKPRMKEAAQRLVQLYEVTGQSDKAAEWKQKLAELQKTEK